jgi:4-hydroxy-3-methylbut-2-en-1-yl diphosphate reductase
MIQRTFVKETMSNPTDSAAEGVKVEVMLANPRGFCAGVERALDIVERALKLKGAPI